MTSYFNACGVTVANSNRKNFLCVYDMHLCPPYFEEGSATYASIYSKRLKPLLKREVNNEAIITSLRSYYQIDYIAYHMQYI